MGLLVERPTVPHVAGGVRRLLGQAHHTVQRLAQRTQLTRCGRSLDPLGLGEGGGRRPHGGVGVALDGGEGLFQTLLGQLRCSSAARDTAGAGRSAGTTVTVDSRPSA